MTFFTHLSPIILPPHVNDPFTNIPTNHGLEPGIASCPPDILEKFSFSKRLNWIPHEIWLRQFTRLTTFLEFDEFLLIHESTINVVEYG